MLPLLCIQFHIHLWILYYDLIFFCTHYVEIPVLCGNGGSSPFQRGQKIKSEIGKVSFDGYNICSQSLVYLWSPPKTLPSLPQPTSSFLAQMLFFSTKCC